MLSQRDNQLGGLLDVLPPRKVADILGTSRRVLITRIQKLRARGVRIKHWRRGPDAIVPDEALLILLKHCASQAEVARAAGVSKSAISRRVQRLKGVT